jgi:hypothetical protein
VRLLKQHSGSARNCQPRLREVSFGIDPVPLTPSTASGSGGAAEAKSEAALSFPPRRLVRSPRQRGRAARDSGGRACKYTFASWNSTVFGLTQRAAAASLFVAPFATTSATCSSAASDRVGNGRRSAPRRPPAAPSRPRACSRAQGSAPAASKKAGVAHDQVHRTIGMTQRQFEQAERGGPGELDRSRAQRAREAKRCGDMRPAGLWGALSRSGVWVCGSAGESVARSRCS